MYYIPEPPYFLVLVGLLIGITSGLAFEGTLKSQVQEWAKTKQSIHLKLGFNLLFPFWGICLGICVFLASGLEIFLLNPWIAYAIACPMTLFITALVWIQLGRLMIQLQEGGSKALDLDAF